jgi:TctA family transporter
MILVGGLNTVNFVLSLVTFLVLDKARNGAVIAIKELISYKNGLT